MKIWPASQEMVYQPFCALPLFAQGVPEWALEELREKMFPGLSLLEEGGQVSAACC